MSGMPGRGRPRRGGPRRARRSGPSGPPGVHDDVHFRFVGDDGGSSDRRVSRPMSLRSSLIAQAALPALAKSPPLTGNAGGRRTQRRAWPRPGCGRRSARSLEHGHLRGHERMFLVRAWLMTSSAGACPGRNTTPERSATEQVFTTWVLTRPVSRRARAPRRPSGLTSGEGAERRASLHRESG